MAVRVYVNESDDIELALQTLKNKVSMDSDRRWYKKRFGYYEKPSILKRKKEKMQSQPNHRCKRLWLKIGLVQQFDRTGPVAVGR